MDERIGIYQSCGNRESVGRVFLAVVIWVVWWGVCRGLDQGLEGWAGVMYV